MAKRVFPPQWYAAQAARRRSLTGNKNAANFVNRQLKAGKYVDVYSDQTRGGHLLSVNDGKPLKITTAKARFLFKNLKHPKEIKYKIGGQSGGSTGKAKVPYQMTFGRY